jgi:cobalt/nickel transport protein
MKRQKQQKQLLTGLAIALAIAIAAPFIASTNPDGLDSTAGKVGAEEKAYSAFPSPMADYLVPILGEGEISSSIALAFGVILIAVLSYGFAFILNKKKV